MSHLQVAIYARVSCEQQTEAHTIQSQLAALRERVAEASVPLLEDLIFIDEGYSGATLVRPALERLRDIAAAGGIDQLYVHSPDRLARKYAYQVLLLEELERSGVEVVFLNHPPGASPEEALLVQVQGMVAEYERAKIMERSRRGKRHAARAGVVNVLAGAPYGYRYVSKHEGGGQARFEILLEEARVVRQVFALGGAGTRDHWRGLSPTDPSRGAHADGQDGLGPRSSARYAQEPRLSGGGRHRPRHVASRCAPACGQSLGVRCTRAGRAR